MSKVAFNKTLNIPKDVASWEKQNQMEMLQEKLDIVTIPWHDYEKVAQMFDVVDVIFDLPGYIAGYGVSPDSRYIQCLHVLIESGMLFFSLINLNLKCCAKARYSLLLILLDSRYLHVNIRSWPPSALFSAPLDPPPVGLCIERIVIDLARMRVIGRSAPRHRVFIPSDPDYCEPAPIQVSRHYIATIAEDKGVIIDRHSGLHVAR